jgi:hypothetical protein
VGDFNKILASVLSDVTVIHAVYRYADILNTATALRLKAESLEFLRLIFQPITWLGGGWARGSVVG